MDLTSASEISNVFFPRWRTRNLWTFRIGEVPNDGQEGFCDSDTKTIYCLLSLDSIDGQVVLIHEICHAVSVPHHGKRFTDRLRKCASQAVDLGLTELAKKLEVEAGNYEDTSYSDTRKLVYSEAENFARCLPELSWQSAEGYIALQVGLNREELRQRFPRAKQIFDNNRNDL